MRIALPEGYTPSYVLEALNLILAANDLPKVNRQDRIRGYIQIPTENVSDVVNSLQAVGLS